MNKKLGILVGASTINKEEVRLLETIKNNNVYLVAVDGGISFFIKHNIKPDFWLGDMDSTKEKQLDKINSDINLDVFLESINKTEVSPIKDDTDMALGIDHALRHDCTDIIIYGGLGGSRMSHTFANVQLLFRYAKQGIRIQMISESSEVFVLFEDKLKLPKKDSGFISILALTDVAENVSIKNLFYEYEGNLTNDVALGVSNEFCGKEAEIAVEKGALVIILEQ